MDVCLLASRAHQLTAERLAHDLDNESISAEVALSDLRPDQVRGLVDSCQIVVGTMKDHDFELAAYLAYALGRSKRTIVATNDSTWLPSLLQTTTIVPLDQQDLRTLVVRLRELLQREPGMTVPQENGEFLRWLSERSERIQDLPAPEFERLACLLLANAGFGSVRQRDEIDTRQFFRDVAERSRVFVECRYHRDDTRIGLETVREMAAEAARRSCAIALLVANSKMTDAAFAYATTSAPPVWHLDSGAIREYVARAVQGRQQTKLRTTPGMLSQPWSALGALCRPPLPPAGSTGATGHLWERRREHIDMAFAGEEDETPFVGSTLLRPPFEYVPVGSRTSVSDAGTSVDWWAKLSSCLPTDMQVAGRESSHVLRDEKASVFVFISSSAAPSEVDKLRVDRILRGLMQHYGHVWHNYSWLSRGNLCSHLSHFSRAVQSSDVLLIIDNVEASCTDKDLKLLNWVAAEFEKAEPRPSVVISNDVTLSRLRLPICFAASVFLDGRADGPNKVSRRTKVK